ncbi:unnamed protein product [Camellia sinensis]
MQYHRVLNCRQIDWKTERYKEIIRSGTVEPRPGVLRLMDEAKDAGDQLAIAKEIGRRLGMGTNMYSSSALLGDHKDQSVTALPIDELIEKANGFAGVFPEHKYEIVKILQGREHTCGMTGDGVNDAPALKKADIGIVVVDATDAARSASDIVLTEPGLSVIISAVLTSRAIFQRMKNYTIYAMSITIRFLLLSAFWRFKFPPFMLFPSTIMTISKDRVKPSPLPDSWKLSEIFATGIVLGISPHKNWRGAYYSIFLLLFRRNYDWNFIFGYGKIPSSLELTTFCEGIVGSAIQVSILVWCLCQRGPLFIAVFHPLGTVISTMVNIIIFGDILYLGSVMESIIIVIGFYSVMWGKSKEQKVITDDEETSSELPREKAPFLQNTRETKIYTYSGEASEEFDRDDNTLTLIKPSPMPSKDIRSPLEIGSVHGGNNGVWNVDLEEGKTK